MYHFVVIRELADDRLREIEHTAAVARLISMAEGAKANERVSIAARIRLIFEAVAGARLSGRVAPRKAS
jgi:hypothetical protein